MALEGLLRAALRFAFPIALFALTLLAAGATTEPSFVVS